MRYVRTFLATLSAGIGIAVATLPAAPAQTSHESSYCNGRGDCIIVLFPDGTWDV